MPLPSPDQPLSAEDALRSLLSAQEQAWNQGDGDAWAAGFAPDADFINIRGDVFKGREEIAQRHAAIFAGPFRGSQSSVTVRQLTMLSPGIALLESIHHVTGFQRLPPGIVATSDGVLDTLMKYIAVLADGQWHFAAAQNTAVLPPAPRPPAPPSL